METISKNIVKFTVYIGKVLLPVLLSSFIFGGILAKYNIEMNMNKSILESAYQPMKQQYRECNREQDQFRRRLGGYGASINGVLESVQLGVAPPAAFWKQYEYPANNSFTSLTETEETWENVMACYGAFTSLLTDVRLMLGDEGKALEEYIDRRTKQPESLVRSKDEIFKKLYSHDLNELFAEVRKSSADEFKRRAKQWKNTLQIAMRDLKELDQMAAKASKAQDDDFDKSNAIVTKQLRKRFEIGPFDFFTRLTR